MTQDHCYLAVFEPAEEGGYVVTFPAIPGLATEGKALNEARAMASDCLKAYLESLGKDGQPAPRQCPGELIVEKIVVRVSIG